MSIKFEMVVSFIPSRLFQHLSKRSVFCVLVIFVVHLYILVVIKFTHFVSASLSARPPAPSLLSLLSDCDLLEINLHDSSFFSHMHQNC